MFCLSKADIKMETEDIGPYPSRLLMHSILLSVFLNFLLSPKITTPNRRPKVRKSILSMQTYQQIDCLCLL